ncbi:MAG: YceI family protein [Cytophagales bacterium]|nr:MAG: YceI family protein [Cytophagales bacterium]
MNQKIVIIYCLLGYITLLPLQAQTHWKPQKGSVSFTIRNAGFNVDGQLYGMTASVYFDLQNLQSATISASVDVNTLETGITARDKHLKAADYFNVAQYPTIRMKSVSFLHKGGGQYVGTFDLTIKGTTKTVQMPFSFQESGSNAIFSGSFEINRLDFGVGDKSMVLDDKVKVSISLSVVK